MVWSQDPATGCSRSLTDLLAIRPAPVVLVGGPGWSPSVPDAVQRVESLAETVEALLRAVGA
jgi:MerR family transcriptional regulator, light-induced transcriptional regulator